MQEHRNHDSENESDDMEDDSDIEDADMEAILHNAQMEEEMDDSVVDLDRDYFESDSDLLDEDSDFTDEENASTEEEEDDNGEDGAKPLSPYGIPYLISICGQRFRYNRGLASRMLRNGNAALSDRVIVERLVPKKLLLKGFVLVGQSLDSKFIYGSETSVSAALIPFEFGVDVLLQHRFIIINPDNKFREVVSTTHEYVKPIGFIGSAMSVKSEMCGIGASYDMRGIMFLGIFNFINNIAFHMEHSFNLIGDRSNVGRCFAVTKDFVVMLCVDTDPFIPNARLIVVFVATDMNQLPLNLSECEEVNLQNRPPPTSSVKTIVYDVKAIYPNKPVNTVYVGVKHLLFTEYMTSLIKDKLGNNVTPREFSADILDINDTVVRLICYVFVIVNSDNRETKYVKVKIKADIANGTVDGEVEDVEPVQSKYRTLADYQKDATSLFPESYTLPCAAYSAKLHRDQPESSIMPALTYGGGYEYVCKLTNKEMDYPLLEEKHIRDKSFT